MIKFFFKKRDLKCTSGATAIEYGLISALIAIASISAIWTTGQETSNKISYIATTLEDRNGLLDDFYDLTAETHCNNFGSCGNNGNQGVWEAFKDTALIDDSFDSLMTDRDSFEVGIFAEARERTQEKLGMSGVSNRVWHNSDQTAARQAAQEVWAELAAENAASQ